MAKDTIILSNSLNESITYEDLNTELSKPNFGKYEKILNKTSFFILTKDKGLVMVSKTNDNKVNINTNAVIDVSDIATEIELERIKYYGDPDIIPSSESYFTVNETGETITGLTNTGKTQTGTLVIPYKINGVTITTLYSGANTTSILAGANDQFTKVILPNTITTIGNSAFRACLSLTSINIPNSVTSIVANAFNNCSSLTSINIPNSVTSIGAGTFLGCSSLTSINIPNSVTSIERSTFRTCSSLTSINIPNSVTTIDSSAFHSISSDAVFYVEQGSYAEIYAKSNSIPIVYTDVKNIATETELERLKYYGDEDIVPSDSSYFTVNETGETITGLTDAGKALTGTLVIPYKINEVKITTLSSGNEFISILDGATDKITKVVIPNSVISIGNGAFHTCSSLTSINIPNSVTTIDSRAFDGCTSLASITIPDSVTSISNYAFYYCTSLTNITIPDSITFISSAMFYGCSSLTSINIPNSVTYIVADAFYECTSLKSVTIPNSVTNIGPSVFYGCTSLTSIVIPDSVTSISDNAFTNISSNAVFYVDQGSYAETFAKNNNIPVRYISIDKSNDTSLHIGSNINGDYKGFSITAITKIPSDDAFTGYYKISLKDSNDVSKLSIGDKILISTSTDICPITDIVEKADYSGTVTYNSNDICVYLPNISNLALVNGTDTGFKVYNFIVKLSDPSIGDKQVSYNTFTMGNNTKAIERSAAAFGENTIAYGSCSFAGGKGSMATDVALAWGLETNALNAGSVSFGQGNNSKGVCSLTAGQGNVTKADNAIAVGYQNNTIARNGFTIGKDNINNSENSLTVGYNLKLSEDNVHYDSDDVFVAGYNEPFLRVKKDGKTYIKNAIIESSDTIKADSLTVKNVVSTKALHVDTGDSYFNGTLKIGKLIDGSNRTYSPVYYWNFAHETVEKSTTKSYDLGNNQSYTVTNDENYSSQVITKITDTQDALILPDHVTNKFHTNPNDLIVGIITNTTGGGHSYSYVHLPNKLKFLGKNAFDYGYFEKIDLPNTLTHIGSSCFYTSRLLEINLPDSVEYVGSHAFYSCTRLRKVKWSSKCVTIPDFCFYGCTSLEEIEIPFGITTINTYAFVNCSNLKRIVLPTTVSNINDSVFDNISSDAIFYVEYGSYAEQWCIDNGKNYKYNIVNPNYIILNSSTPGSTKKFKITIDDSGTLSSTEI